MPPPLPCGLVFSCEHGGRRVPAGSGLDPGSDPELRAALPTHRGWDPGALGLARQMATLFDAPLRFSTISRLVVEPNRSPENPEIFSPWSRELPAPVRRRLLRRYHRRHRERVRRAVEGAAAGPPPRTRVVHVGVHSFTPVLDGQERPVEVGILLDPARSSEREVAEAWAEALAGESPGLRILLNEPYDGRSDGLVTTLREAFAEGIRPGCAYVGLELEVNQGLLGPGGTFPRALAASLATTLAAALRSHEGSVRRGRL